MAHSKSYSDDLVASVYSGKWQAAHAVDTAIGGHSPPVLSSVFRTSSIYVGYWVLRVVSPRQLGVQPWAQLSLGHSREYFNAVRGTLYVGKSTAIYASNYVCRSRGTCTEVSIIPSLALRAGKRLLPFHSMCHSFCLGCVRWV